MKTIALLFSAVAATLAAADGTPSVIAFSDAGKPGSVRIHIGQGSITVVGTDDSDVSVRSSLSPKDSEPERKDGLRVISTASGFSLSEKDNVVELAAGLDGPGRGVPASFKISVPRSAAVTVVNSWGGDITVENVAGDVEIKNLGGKIVLNEVTGGALVETLNGRINATFPTLPSGKALSFTSMNGEVQLRVPADARANVRFRTQNGNVLTDFDEGVLVTQSEAMELSSMEEFSKAAAEAARAGRKIALEQVEHLKRMANEVEKRRESRTVLSRKMDQDGSSDSASSSSSASASANSVTIRAPKPPRPPSIPSFSGGKIVHGTLNGGGSEIQIATMNGDIVLRKNAP